MVLVVKNPPANAGDTRDVGSIPGSWKILWSRKWQPNPVVLPRESHGQRSLGKFMESQIVGHNWSDLTHTHAQNENYTNLGQYYWKICTRSKYRIVHVLWEIFLHFFPFVSVHSEIKKKKMIYAKPSWKSEVFTKFILLIKLRFLADQGQMTGFSQIFPLILRFFSFFFTSKSNQWDRTGCQELLQSLQQGAHGERGTCEDPGLVFVTYPHPMRKSLTYLVDLK